MAIGKSGVTVKQEKLSILMGSNMILKDGKLDKNYNENILSDYMKNENIDFDIEISTGSRNFTAYTMDLTKEYIKINADYRS